MNRNCLIVSVLICFAIGPVSVAAQGRTNGRPAPALTEPPIILPFQAARIAKAYVLKTYRVDPDIVAIFGPGIFPSGPGAGAFPTTSAWPRCFAYTAPEGLVNWNDPQVTFVKAITMTQYRGSGWQVHFIAPHRPGVPPNVVEMPGDDFDILLARDGRVLGTEEGMD